MGEALDWDAIEDQVRRTSGVCTDASGAVPDSLKECFICEGSRNSCPDKNMNSVEQTVKANWCMMYLRARESARG